MKANKALKISLAAIVAACAIPVGTVFAAENGTTNYPVKTTVDEEVILPFECKLTFSEEKPITDYAVSGDSVAFASYTSMYVLYTGKNGDRKLDDEHHYSGSNRIEMLDYVNGNLYLDVKSDGVFLYPDYSKTVTHEFPDQGNTVKLSTNEEYRLSNDGLHYFSGDDHEVLGTDYTNLKIYDDKAFAVKDNVLYTFAGNTPSRVDVAYTDFDEAENILCGDVASKLTAPNYEVKTTEIKPNSYYTQINPDIIGKANDTFIPIRTEKTNVDKPCIVLCESGNATIVATNDGMYITATENLNKPYVTSTQKNDWEIGSDGKRLAAYAIEDVGVYASPFMSKSTQIATLKSGAENHVEVIEKFEFGSVKFYRIRYEVKTIDESTGETKTDTISGFVAANMLTPYNFKAEDNQPTPSGSDKFSFKTNTASVILAIVIVALVIIAIMYIMLIGSKKDKSKFKKKEQVKEQPKRDPVDEDEEE